MKHREEGSTNSLIHLMDRYILQAWSGSKRQPHFIRVNSSEHGDGYNNDVCVHSPNAQLPLWTASAAWRKRHMSASSWEQGARPLKSGSWHWVQNTTFFWCFCLQVPVVLLLAVREIETTLFCCHQRSVTPLGWDSCVGSYSSSHTITSVVNLTYIIHYSLHHCYVMINWVCHVPENCWVWIEL